MKDEDKTPPENNGFMAVLQRKEVQDGLISEASDRLQTAVIAAMGAGKKASVTVTLTVEPQKGRAINVAAAVTSKLPAIKQDSLTIFYPDDQGGLHRNDFRQKELGLEIREGGATTPQIATAPDAQQAAS